MLLNKDDEFLVELGMIGDELGIETGATTAVELRADDGTDELEENTLLELDLILLRGTAEDTLLELGAVLFGGAEEDTTSESDGTLLGSVEEDTLLELSFVLLGVVEAEEVAVPVGMDREDKESEDVDPISEDEVVA